MANSTTMDADLLSRLGVQLKSGSSSWDEIVAFTERILNKNFETIFNRFDSMKAVQWDDPSVGTVDVVLKAPRIIIPGEEDMFLAKTVFFQLRFESGYIATSTGSAQADVTNWELAIPCELNTHEPESEKSSSTKRKCTVNGRIYNYPGDYSVQRLFAQLSTARWNDPRPEHSQVWDAKASKFITIQDWMKIGYNSKLWGVLKNVLQSWATDEEAAGRSTLNVTFQLPPVNYDPIEHGIRYAPTFLHQQTYPYISPEKGVEKGETKLAGNGFNALLWCEMVADRTPPKTLAIPWTGNFVVPPRSNTGDDAIDGTFALSYTHFLEHHLLPRLYRFNQAVEVVDLTETYSYKENSYWTSWNYQVGNFNLDSNDPYFAFTRIEPTVPNENAKYVFDKPHSTDKAIHVWEGGHAAKLIHQSKCNVTVSWDLGGRTVYVHGYTEYEFDQTHARNTSFAAGDITGRLRYKYYLNWDIALVLIGVANGVMKWEVKVEGRDGKPKGNIDVTQDKTIQQDMTVPDGQDERIRKWFTENIHRCIDQLPDDLAHELSSTASFTYPGAGYLNFSDPVINRYGNILATISHNTLEIEPDYIDVKAAIKIPPPKLLGIEPKVTTVGQGVSPPVAKLIWEITPNKTDAFKDKTKFVLSATNNGSEKLGFGYLRVRFCSASEGPNLFRNNKINNTANRIYKPPRPAPTSTPMPVAQVPSPKKDSETGSAPSNPAASTTPAAGGFGRKILGSLGVKLGGGETPKPADPPASNEKSVASGLVAPDGPAQPPVVSAQHRADPAEKPESDSTPAPADTVAPKDTAVPAGPDAPSNTEQKMLPGDPVGTIKVTASSPDIKIAVTPMLSMGVETANGQIYWQLVTQAPEGLPGFVLAPGESINYEFEVDTGAANAYGMYITESWRLADNLQKRPVGVFTSDDKVVSVILKLN